MGFSPHLKPRVIGRSNCADVYKVLRQAPWHMLKFFSVLIKYNVSIHIHHKYMKPVNPLPELLFNKRKKDPRDVE